MKICREEKNHLKSDLLMKPILIDSKISSKRANTKPRTGDIYSLET